LYVGWYSETATTSLVSAINTVTLTNTGGDYPVFTLNGPTTAGTYCTLVWLENQTTGKKLYFNLKVWNGESIVITFGQNMCSVISSTRGTILSQPFAGSDANSFRLQFGSNKVAVFVLDTITGVTCSMTYKEVRRSLA
jgi:hypothetical protein